ncbi:PEP-CTERM sorting domain-containing protein [Pirellulales bacterium]|nr:PEP-CTERM sorting domain-containing protein [Pirellulales bacterium]
MIGQLAGAKGTVNIGDGNALAHWNVAGSLYMGGSDTQSGGNGLLNINSQGTVTVGNELRISDNGTVFLNSAAATLSVGALTRATGSQFFFQQGNLVLTGSGLNINAAGSLGTSVSVVPGQTLSTTGGGLVNDGDLNVIGTTVSFTGGPSVNNAGAEVNAINATLTFDGDLTNNGDVNLINSTVNGNLINGGTGTLAMIGSNAFRDDLDLDGNDNLYVDIGGTTIGEWDVITVGGVAVVDGNLNVSLVSGFTPTAGDAFAIITATSILGSFVVESLPTLAGRLEWFVVYTGTSVELISSFAGDFNLDGDVDGRDFLLWQRDPSVGSLADWETNYGMVAPLSAISSTTVPEPTTLLLGAMASIGLMLRRWV